MYSFYLYFPYIFQSPKSPKGGLNKKRTTLFFHRKIQYFKWYSLSLSLTFNSFLLFTEALNSYNNPALYQFPFSLLSPCIFCSIFTELTPYTLLILFSIYVVPHMVLSIWNLPLPWPHV